MQHLMGRFCKLNEFATININVSTPEGVELADSVLMHGFASANGKPIRTNS
jgi:hypothetical protein